MLAAVALAAVADVQVIGAGFGRSGTASLAAALKELGHKVFHAEDSFENSGVWADLHAAAKSGDAARVTSATEAAIDAVADKGFTATTDFPTCTIYDGFLRRYPDAKVILTERATPELWAESFVATIARMTWISSQPPFSWVAPDISPLHVWCFEGVGLKLTEPKMLPTVEQAAETVVQWRERVRRTVPKSQLLEFKVTDGWKPLCDFLEVAECPTGPFPHAWFTSRRNIKIMIDTFEAIVSNPALAAAAAGAVVLALLAAFFSCVSSFLPRKAKVA